MGNAIKARNEKSQLKCFVCLKILKTPVYLPCSCRLTICYEHVLKESRIRCKKCKVTFATNVKHLFKEDDKKLKKLAAYSYLNRIEKKHFQTMSTLLKQTKHISETLSIKILEFPLVQYEHFSQLRNKIDIDRETSIQAVYANVTHLKRRTKILEKLHKLSEKLLKQIDTNEILFRNEYTLKKSSWSAFSNAYFDYDREIERLSEIFREPKKFTQTFLHKLTRDYLLEHDSMQRKLDEFERIENDLKLYGSFDSSILFESLLQRLDCIAVSSDDRCQIDIWDMDKCVKIDSLYGHTRPVVCLSLYGDNDIKLVSGSDDGLIKIWNLDEKFECVKTLRGHLSGIICLKIIRHKLHCVSASHDKTIKIWCLREFICLFTLGDPQRRLSCLELLKRYLF